MTADTKISENQIPLSSEAVIEIFENPEIIGEIPPVLSGVCDDSRKISEGMIFVAIVGYETDGHNYVKSVSEAGAGLICVQRSSIEKDPSIIRLCGNSPTVIVTDTRRAISFLASAFYGNPSAEMSIFGITGTKGKTTTAHLLSDILKAGKRETAVMGTLGLEAGGEIFNIGLTTPGPVEFQSYLRRLRNLGVRHLAAEISAHSGGLSRTASVRFESVSYLNLSRDHLDHFTESGYLNAKLAISRDAVKVNPEVKGIANARDPHCEKFLEPVAERNRFRFAVYEEYEKAPMADKYCGYVGQIKSRSSSDLIIFIQTTEWEREVRLPLVGRFNAQNAVAAAAIAGSTGINPKEIQSGLENAKPVAGRFERVDKGQDFLVIVDYAHAPQPAKEVLTALREITKGRLIALMGAGGNRDKGKRPMIGEVLATSSDIAFITSDNPRKENPEEIVKEIFAGAERAESRTAEIIVEVDRKIAIEKAMSMAKPGDTVAILGKGHENYQIFADRTIHFDDREVAAEWLIEHGYGEK